MRFWPANAPKLLLLATSLILLTGCSGGRPPFRMVQFCLSGPSEFALLKSEFKSISNAYGMSFQDNSSQTEANLADISKNTKIRAARPTINIAAYNGKDLYSVGAGNFAEAPLQIAAGFNGSDLLAARKFSDEAVRELGRHWRIHEVEHLEQHGAFPLAVCP